MRATFTFLSVVEYLRQFLPKKLQEWLDENIFLRETEVWNAMAGPVFRCDLLVNTSCADESDDRAFTSGKVSWSEGVPEFTPLLVQDVDSEVTYAAVLHRYSGLRREAVGVARGKCCITGCANEFPSNQPGGWWLTFLREHPKNQHDEEKLGPVCDLHRKRITRADKRNRKRQIRTSIKRVLTSWTNPMEAAVQDAEVPPLSDAIITDHETIRIYFHDSQVNTQRLVTYAREAVNAPWTLEKSAADDVPLPASVRIVPEDSVPLRHAKTRTRFREHLLRKVHDCHKVLGNLLLSNVLSVKIASSSFTPTTSRLTN